MKTYSKTQTNTVFLKVACSVSWIAI